MANVTFAIEKSIITTIIKNIAMLSLVSDQREIFCFVSKTTKGYMETKKCPVHVLIVFR